MSKKTLTVITLSLLIIFYFPRIGFGQAPTAQEYFDKASLQYLMGHLDDALANLKAALRIDPEHAGTQKLVKIILREMKVVAEKPKAELIQENLAALRRSLAGIKEEERIKTWQYRKTLAILVMVFLGLAVLLSFSAIALERMILGRIAKRKKTGYCFNCGAKISPNIDMCPSCGAWIGTKMGASISKTQKIWYSKAGWHKNPFTLDIHPELFTGYRNEVKKILEKLAAGSGHILVTGPLGIGKTTLLRWLANYLAAECRAIYISRPPLEFNQLIKLIIQNMGFSLKQVVEYDIYHLDELRKKMGKMLVLLLDEAHEFTIEIERPLRTLGDLDQVNLVMAGLPETVDKLKNEIQPLYERLVLEITLEHLGFEDLKELIKVRIENAGGEGIHPFAPAALEKIYELSRGIPRLAIKICDWAVTQAINQGVDQIGPEILRDLKT